MATYNEPFLFNAAITTTAGGTLGGTFSATGSWTYTTAPIISSLTASYAVVTDGSKQLSSLQYTTAATASTLAQRDGSGNLNVVGLNASTLTASQAVVTDGSKNLASLGYSSANTASYLVQRDSNKFILCDGITLTSGGTAASTKLTLATTTWQIGGTNSTITEAGAASFATSVTSPLLDYSGALEVGKTSATSLNLSRSTITTTVKGLLNVDEAVTFDTTLGVAGVLTCNYGTGGSFTIPTGRGSVGNVLTTDGAGATAWTAIGAGGIGDVIFSSGIGAAVDNAICRFDNTTGKLIQAYSATSPTFSDAGILTVNNATDSSAYTDGCAIFAGGVGIAKKLYAKSTVNIDTLTASYAVVTDASKNLSSLQYTTTSTASALVQRDASADIYCRTLNASGLTASYAVVTDGSKNLASLQYTTAATASTLVQRDASANITTTLFLGGAGAVGGPTFSFASDSDTGIYNSGANTLDFATNGIWGGSISSTRAWILGPTSNKTVVHTLNGHLMAGTAASMNSDYKTIGASSGNMFLLPTDPNLYLMGGGYYNDNYYPTSANTAIGRIKLSGGTSDNSIIVELTKITDSTSTDYTFTAGTALATQTSLFKITYGGLCTLGTSGVAASHTAHGYISSNGGGTSGSATTEHPYFAIKKLTGTTDGAGDLTIAHGLTSGAKIKMIEGRIAAPTAGFYISIGCITQANQMAWDDTNVVINFSSSDQYSKDVVLYLFYESA